MAPDTALPTTTDSNDPDETSGRTRPDEATPSPDPGEGGPYAGAPAPAREDTTTNSSNEDEPDSRPDGIDAPDPDETATDSDDGAEGDSKPGIKERAVRTAVRWGVDVHPPRFHTNGLPPLSASGAYARRGAQAPVTGTARVAARGWYVATYGPRWLLRLFDHLLERPGRFLVAAAVVLVAARVEAVRNAVAIVAAVADNTVLTALRFLLGL